MIDVKEIKESIMGNSIDILWLAVPVMLEQMTQILLGTVDSFFAGKISDSAIAGIGITNMFMNLFVAVLSTASIGVIVLVSRSLGEKNSMKASLVVKQAIILGIILSIVIGIVNGLFGKIFFQLAGAENDIIDVALPYFYTVSIPVVFMCLTLILANGLKAAGNTKLPMIISVIANIVNALLDWVFIKLGMGVLGLGLATTISRALNMLLLLVIYVFGYTVLKIHITHWHVNLSVMKGICKIGIPACLTNLSSRIVMLFQGSVILYLGSSVYVANNIAQTIDDYACIPSAGFEAATASMVGKSVGEKNNKKVIKIVYISLILSCLFMTTIGGVLALFSGTLAGLFTQTNTIQSLVVSVLQMMFFFQWTSACSHVLTSGLQGTGDTKYPFYITLLGNIIMRLALGYLLAFHARLGLVGIWLGIVCDFVFRSIFMWIRLGKEKWQNIKIG